MKQRAEHRTSNIEHPTSKLEKGETEPDRQGASQILLFTEPAATWLLRYKNGGKKRGKGRPPLIKLELIERIGAHIAMGLPEKEACLLECCNYESFKTACKRKEDFELVIARERAKFFKMALEQGFIGSPGWAAYKFTLERRHRAAFAAPDVSISATATATASAPVMGLNEEQFKDLQRIAGEQFAGKRN